TRSIADALATIKALGAEIREVRFPDPTQIVADWRPLRAAEAAVAHEATFPSRRDDYGPVLAGLLDQGRRMSALDYQKIVLRRKDFRGRVRALFQTIDLLLVPAHPFASPTEATMATRSANPELGLALLRFTSPFDMSGNPTITLPC